MSDDEDEQLRQAIALTEQNRQDHILNDEDEDMLFNDNNEKDEI